MSGDRCNLLLRRLDGTERQRRGSLADRQLEPTGDGLRVYVLKELTRNGIGVVDGALYLEDPSAT